VEFQVDQVDQVDQVALASSDNQQGIAPEIYQLPALIHFPLYK
jgi:hypothetical protein